MALAVQNGSRVIYDFAHWCATHFRSERDRGDTISGVEEEEDDQEQAAMILPIFGLNSRSVLSRRAKLASNSAGAADKSRFRKRPSDLGGGAFPLPLPLYLLGGSAALPRHHLVFLDFKVGGSAVPYLVQSRAVEFDPGKEEKLSSSQAPSLAAA